MVFLPLKVVTDRWLWISMIGVKLALCKKMVRFQHGLYAKIDAVPRSEGLKNRINGIEKNS